MSDTVQLALQLLAIGMITVFLILFLVVQTTRLLINVVNRYWPEDHTTPLVQESQPPPSDHSIDPKVVATIGGAVSHLTGGKGKIKSIEKN